MGSVVLKLQLSTWIFWLLFLLPFWEWLLLSLDMATAMDMVMVMVMDMVMVDMATMDMARGLLNLLLQPNPDMDIMDTMVRGLLMLSQLLLLSQDMDMVMAMDII